MPSRPVGVTDTANAAGVVEVDVIERASPDLTTTTTADPGSGGTTLAVTANAKFPASGNYKIAVEAERMLVTAGQGTNSWTVTRGIDNTTAVAHTTGVTVSYVVGMQRVSPVDERQISYIGRSATFKTLGRAGTSGQKIFAIHNATASKILVDVQRITVDVMQTAARVIEPPMVRLWKFTAVPTNGSAVTKVPEDSALSSNASVTLWQDASADSTGSGTTLTVTLPAATVVSQSWGPRALTLVGYEQFDRETFLEAQDERVTLRALEGICVFLDYTAAVANPVTDKWMVTCRWIEYTIP
jgi:hypothetical protein